ncbi:hypothetical protein Tco_1165320 [Tanacetum coccineum]
MPLSFLPYGLASFADTQAMFRYGPWNACHICGFLGYFGWIATLIPSTAVDSWGRGLLGASATIMHFAVLCPGWPIIPLYGDRDLTTMKFIRALVECFPSPKDTISDICPNDQDISPLNPRRGVVAGTILFFYFWV